MGIKKGFIQISILIAIIASVLVLSGGGYFGVKQYQNYKAGKIEKDKETQAAAETQRKALEIAQQEIEKLKEQGEQSQQKQAVLEQKLSSEITKPKEITIQSSELNPYLSGVANIECGDTGGSGSFWNLENFGRIFITNFHVIENKLDGICMIFDADEKNSTGLYLVSPKNRFTWNKQTDIAVLPVEKAITPEGAGKLTTPIEGLNYKISLLRKCKTQTAIGSPVIIVGYPQFTGTSVYFEGKEVRGSTRTATNGIISGYDTSSKFFRGLPYSDYYISAKIDSGNSGGIAFSKDESGLCILGIPTWLTVGNYETQGIVQNIHNIFYLE